MNARWMLKEKPVPVGPELLQRYDEAAKRFNESKTQGKSKATPKGGNGISASMITLDPEGEEEVETCVSCSAVQTSDD